MEVQQSINYQLEPLEVPCFNKVRTLDIQMVDVEAIVDGENFQSFSKQLQKIDDFLNFQNNSYEIFEQSSSTNEGETPHNLADQKTLATDSQLSLQRKSSNRPHLNRNRKKRGDKTQLQKQFRGYWTKNFLPIGKNPHFDWIELKMGSFYILNNIDLVEMKKKNGMTMEDYIMLYQMEDLKGIWSQFFKRRILYREVMLSRALTKSKLVFIKFLYRFKEASETGVFDHIA